MRFGPRPGPAPHPERVLFPRPQPAWPGAQAAIEAAEASEASQEATLGLQASWFERGIVGHHGCDAGMGWPAGRRRSRCRDGAPPTCFFGLGRSTRVPSAEVARRLPIGRGRVERCLRPAVSIRPQPRHVRSGGQATTCAKDRLAQRLPRAEGRRRFAAHAIATARGNSISGRMPGPARGNGGPPRRTELSACGRPMFSRTDAGRLPDLTLPPYRSIGLRIIIASNPAPMARARPYFTPGPCPRA
jgi:hypothetical protein